MHFRGNEAAENTSVTTDDFETYVAEATELLIEENRLCEERFNIGQYERFYEDQKSQSLVWTTSGVPKVAAKIQIVGTLSKKMNTWLWSWANTSVLDVVKSDILQVKQFGEKHAIEKLITETWPAEEVDGWEMTAIAARILGAKGAYRTPTGHLYSFCIYTEINWATSTTNYWPFSQQKNSAVFSIRSIVKDGAPILHVSHDADDDWQFLGIETPRLEDAMVICFHDIVDRDPSLRQLANLPLWWHARRKSRNDPLRREPNPH